MLYIFGVIIGILIAYLNDDWIMDWYYEHCICRYNIKTDTIETVNKFRWVAEIDILLKRKKAPWCKGYRIDHYRKHKIFPWIKYIEYSTHEIIPNSDFLLEGWKYE